ncbi:hypothetical protein [Streptomyces sp. RK31]|nr:hypothetical protein [Streptomyces sp. RK31]
MRTKCDCGKELPPYCGTGRRPIYCSRSCRSRAYYQRKTYGITR